MPGMIDRQRVRVVANKLDPEKSHLHGLNRGGSSIAILLLVICIVSVQAQNSPDYDALVQQGKTQLQAGSNDLALASANAAIKTNADRWEAYALAGGALMNLKRYEEAADRISKSIENAPEPKQEGLRELRRKCLLAESGAATAPALSRQSGPEATTTQAEIVLWKSIENSTHGDDFKAYLVQYPHGAFETLAEARIENFDWERIQNSNDLRDFSTFLHQYPSGNHAAQANAQFARLRGEIVKCSGQSDTSSVGTDAQLLDLALKCTAQALSNERKISSTVLITSDQTREETLEYKDVQVDPAGCSMQYSATATFENRIKGKVKIFPQVEGHDPQHDEFTANIHLAELKNISVLSAKESCTQSVAYFNSRAPQGTYRINICSYDPELYRVVAQRPGSDQPRPLVSFKEKETANIVAAALIASAEICRSR
jgi:tetratricopeptide (TPR) repeat protein